jgi:PAS domain S-box-containing protein
VQLFESAHNNLPVPMWLKDMDGRFLSVNDALVDRFKSTLGIGREGWIGKNDWEIWGNIPEIQRITNNDKLVLRTGNTWRGIETVRMNGEEVNWYSVKYLRKVDGVVVGIGGIAMDINEICKQCAMPKKIEVSDEND